MLIKGQSLPNSSNSYGLLGYVALNSLICSFGNNTSNFSLRITEISLIDFDVSIGTDTLTDTVTSANWNSSVIFDDPNDIVYLYRLAEESPLTYSG